MAVITVGILIKTEFLAKAFGVERPAFGVGGVILVLAEGRKFGQFLGDGDLHVMAGNALVVGGGFDIEQQTFFKIAGVDHDVSRTGAIHGGILIGGGGCFLFAKLLNGKNLQFRFGEPAEKFGEFGIHLVDVFGVEIQDLFAGMGVKFGISGDGGVERFEIAKSEFGGDGLHAGFDFFDLGKPELVDFIGSEIGGGAVFDAEGVVGVAIGEGPDAGFAAAVRSIILTDKFGEMSVSGEGGITNGGNSLLFQASLVGLGEGFGEILKGLGEGRIGGGMRRDVVGLLGNFLEKEARRHEAIGNAFLHLDDGLVEKARHELETRDVVVVILDGLEGKNQDKLRKFDLNAVLLVDGHFPRLEASAVELHFEVANHEALVEEFLFGEAGGINGFKAGKEFLRFKEIFVDSFLREIVELVVPALVAEERGKEGAGAEAVFPLFGEKIVESFAAGFKGGS